MCDSERGRAIDLIYSIRLIQSQAVCNLYELDMSQGNAAEEVAQSENEH